MKSNSIVELIRPTKPFLVTRQSCAVPRLHVQVELRSRAQGRAAHVARRPPLFLRPHLPVRVCAQEAALLRHQPLPVHFPLFSVREPAVVSHVLEAGKLLLTIRAALGANHVASVDPLV